MIPPSRAGERRPENPVSGLPALLTAGWTGVTIYAQSSWRRSPAGAAGPKRVDVLKRSSDMFSWLTSFGWIGWIVVGAIVLVLYNALQGTTTG